MPTPNIVQQWFTTPNYDITNDLLNVLESPIPIDYLELYFGEGEYFLSEPVLINCNVKIRGLGKGTSKITILEGDPFVSNSTRITICGSTSQKISVDVRDIEISMAEHSTIWWNSEEKLLIKILYADSVKFHNVICHCMNAICTNLDMRVCSNVNISDCEFVNYNNSSHGGVIWMRRDTRNVTITRNRFVKYGNDEMFAFWKAGDDDSADAPTPASGIKENILIADNDLVFKKPAWATDMILSVQISLYNDYQSPDTIPTKFTNFNFVNNRIEISTPIVNFIGINFGPYDQYDRIAISNNSITCTDNSSATNSRFSVFSVTNKSTCNVPVEIENNIISSAAITTDSHGDSSRVLFSLTDSNVRATGNVFTGIYTKVGNKPMGTTLLCPQNNGCELTLIGNKLRGINKIGSFTRNTLTSNFNVTLIARDNLFSGDTRIYCKNLANGHLTFENNFFISECYEMLLQEFASGGNLLFNNNEIVILYQGGNGIYHGRLFVHYSGGLPANAHFDIFEVTGNVVRGTTQGVWLATPTQSDCDTYTVSGNTFYSLPW